MPFKLENIFFGIIYLSFFVDFSFFLWGTRSGTFCICINITKHKITIGKITFFIPIPHLSPSLSFPFSSISFSYIRISPSLISLHPCAQLSLSSQHILHLLSSPSVQYLLSLSSFSHLNLAFIFLFLALSLSPGTREFPVIHLPAVPWFFDSLPSFLLVRILVPFIQFPIHPSFFCLQSFHFFTGIPVPLSLFSVLFFFSLQHFVSLLHSSVLSILYLNFSAFLCKFGVLEISTPNKKDF
jgi:hypothetical protein